MFFNESSNYCIVTSGVGMIYLGGYGAAPAKKIEKWCSLVLKCFLIKCLDKNSLKISIFIATITEKAVSLCGTGSYVSTEIFFEKNGAIRCISCIERRKPWFIYRGKIWKKWCILKCILIIFQGKNSLKMLISLGGYLGMLLRSFQTKKVRWFTLSVGSCVC